MPPFINETVQEPNEITVDSPMPTDPLLKKRDFSYFFIKHLNNTRYIFVDSYRYGIVWPNVFAFVFLHIVYFYGLLHLAQSELYPTWILGFFYGFFSSIGVTIGAHRLWSHRAYKAKLPLRILFMICHTMAGQNDLYTWCRDHRLHHKYSETDADPHNSNRGFFFSHVGWLLTKKHPDVIIKGKTIDCSDLLNDPVVRFQRKYYPWMFLFFCFFLPTYLCRLIFGNSWKDAFMVGCFGRYIVSLHTTWFVNSAAHMFGDRPFNEKIAARDNLGVALPLWATEGFHNYHHVFPWDYRISEMGFHNYNPFARLIDFFAKIGLACDLKRPSDELIAKVKANAHKEKPHAYDEPHEF